MKRKNLYILPAILLPLFIGFLGSLLTTSKIDSWYQFINKPSFNPPNWVFSPVWSLLFVLMGISLFLILRKKKSHNRKQALIVFAIQLFLKRNLISIFLPAGGFSSLAFFNKSLTKKGIETTDIYYGSTIYGFVSLLSVIIVAIPVFLILLMKSRLTTTELFPFRALLVLLLIVIFVVW